MPPTTKRMLVEHLYAGDLDTDVREALAAGMSWRQIATMVRERTNVSVSYETMRTWFGTDVDAVA